MLIEYIAKNIRGSIIYIALSISTYKETSLSTIISIISIHYLLLIIDKLSLIHLILFFAIGK